MIKVIEKMAQKGCFPDAHLTSHEEQSFLFTNPRKQRVGRFLYRGSSIEELWIDHGSHGIPGTKENHERMLTSGELAQAVCCALLTVAQSSPM